MFNRNKPQPQLVQPRPAIRQPSPPAAPVVGPDGFEPCFVRDLVNDDQIAIQQPGEIGLTRMTVSRIYRSGITIRQEMDDAQWIGTLEDGRQVHCSHKQQAPAWRIPRVPETVAPDADGFTIPPSDFFTQV